MANKFAKDFENDVNRNFGSFTPKDSVTNNDKMSGAKNDLIDPASFGEKKTPQSGSSHSSGGVASDGGLSKASVAQTLNDANPVKNAEQGMKASVKASMSGGDVNEATQDQKDKDSNASHMATNAAKHKALRKGVVKGGKAIASKSPAGHIGSAIGSKLTGGAGALKGLGSGAVTAVKGAIHAIGAGVVKAGGVVASALNVSATVGTAIVLSGTLAATALPTAGLIGYGVTHHTQRTDGCTPEEYDYPSASGGELIAVTAEQLSWPEGTAHSQYDYDEGGKPTAAMAAAADEWYPELKNGSWEGKSGGYWKMACCCHSANVIVRTALKTNKIGNLLPNCSSPEAAKEELERSLEGQGFSIFPYDGHESSLKRGDVLCYAKKGGGGHVWIYLGEGKSSDGGRTSNVFSHISKSRSRDCDLGGYHYYMVMRKNGGSGTSVASQKPHIASSTVTSRKNIQATIDWARMIAADDSYVYGKGHNSFFSCDYCHVPNASRKAYTCMPFVAAAYAHGTNDPVLMNGGRHRMYLDDKNLEGQFASVWGRVGYCKDLNFTDLQPGDVLIKYDATHDDCNGHAWLYGGGDTYFEASGSSIDEKTGAENKFNKYKNGENATGSGDKNYVMRYIGDGSPLFGSAAYNAEVADMTANDGCGGEMDGAFQEDAYIGKGMKKVTADNGQEYIILDCDLESCKETWATRTKTVFYLFYWLL